MVRSETRSADKLEVFGRRAFEKGEVEKPFIGDGGGVGVWRGRIVEKGVEVVGGEGDEGGEEAGSVVQGEEGAEGEVGED